MKKDEVRNKVFQINKEAIMKTILMSTTFTLAFFLISSVFSSDEITMKGTYKSIKYGSGPMTGIFTKTGKNQYNAVFKFVWKKRDYTYTGTVKGNLTKGKVSGDILNETKKRRFIFKAKVNGGKMRGTQWETYGKTKKKPRGTFEIKK